MTKGTLALLLVAVLPAGCGYHVVGRDGALPKSIQVIAVPAFENKTSSYRLEQRLTAATIHEFLARTSYKIVADPASADAVLTGKITSLEATPLLINTSDPTNVRATVMLVTVVCDVTLTDSSTQKILYHNNNFLFRNQYEITSDVKSFFEEQDPALDRLARDFAQRLVTAVTENY
jgi:outer membrane lipopolysaccharide assembly protein LptE/RlpB